MEKIYCLIFVATLSACDQTNIDDNAHDTASHTENSTACTEFGPQTPRDIANALGTNKVKFPIAPPSSEMNLCNIHFHQAAEHKAPAFSIEKLLIVRVMVVATNAIFQHRYQVMN